MSPVIRSIAWASGTLAFLVFSLRPAAAIVNGRRTEAYPAVVSLNGPSALSPETQAFCTGMRLAPGVFLTATHCAIEFAKMLTESAKARSAGEIFPRFNEHSFYLGAGDAKLRVISAEPMTGAIFPARTGAAPEDACPEELLPEIANADFSTYCLDPTKDVAIVRAEEVGGGEIPTLALSETTGTLGDAVEVVGYGATSARKLSARSGVKRRGENTIIDRDENFWIISGKSDTRRFLGIAIPELHRSISGHGDSGGPLLRAGRVIGVASYAESLRSEKSRRSDVHYVRVDESAVRAFIAEKLGETSMPAVSKP